VHAAPRLPEVPLETGTLVLGDLHLDVSSRGPQPEAFAGWLRSLEDVPRLVILGDLFDAWVGPAHARLPAAREVCELLAALTRHGTAVEVLHGNRDFLLDDAFEAASGARVHPRGLVGLLPGRAPSRALLVHGDELCTRDHAYQRMKRLLRSRPVRWAAERLPDGLALWAARRLRATSVRAVASKPQADKEQQADAVLALATAHRCALVACGHAHRFRDQQLPGGPRWWVVDAFGHGRDLLRVDGRGGLEPLSSGAGAPQG
jgi:UDP-2,3-diacylglucosamine hydrolase